jgi:hypothetical protein
MKKEHLLSQEAYNALRKAPIRQFKDGKIEIDATYHYVIVGSKVKHTFVLIDAPVSRRSDVQHGYRSGLEAFAFATVGYKVAGVWLATNHFGNTSRNMVDHARGLRDVGTVYATDDFAESLGTINRIGHDLIVELLHEVVELTDGVRHVDKAVKRQNTATDTVVNSIAEVNALFIETFQSLEKSRAARKKLRRDDIDAGTASVQALSILFDEYVKSTGAKPSTVEVVVQDINVPSSKNKGTGK